MDVYINIVLDRKSQPRCFYKSVISTFRSSRWKGCSRVYLPYRRRSHREMCGNNGEQRIHVYIDR